MKTKIIIVVSIVVALGGAGFFLLSRQSQEERVVAAFSPIDCPVSPRTFEPGSYAGPMIDAHIHIAPIPDGPPGLPSEMSERPALGVNVSIDDYVCMMNVEGTRKALVFFPVWDPVRQEMLEVAQRTMAKYPDRFIPFIMPPNRDDSPTGFPTVDAATLTDMLAVYPGLFKGYGEIGLYARDGGAPELPPNAPRLMDIYPVVRQNNLLVYFHLGQGHKDSYERVLRDNPDMTFIFHGDQLIEDAGGGDHLELIDEILTNHPNVRYGVDELYGDVFLLRPGVSKEAFISHLQNRDLIEQDVATWKAFIEQHPDQVMWDTDRGWSAPWSLDPEVAIALNDYSRAFIGRLDPAVQEKYAYKNAEMLLKE